MRSKDTEEVEKELENAINKNVDLTIVHHVEGITRITTGKLLKVTKQLIKIELEWKEHFWSRKVHKATYICNRNASSILSLVVRETESPTDKVPAVDLKGAT